MGRRLKIILFAVVLPLVLIAGGGTVLVRKLRSELDKPRTAKVERGDVVVAVRETGFVEPVKRVEVKSEVAGQLTYLAVDEGDTVAENQVIARLDVPELEAQRDQVKAQLDAARARLRQAELASELDRETIESQLEQSRAGLAAARFALEEAGTRLADAERVYENKRQLFEMGGYVSRNEMDSAKATLDLATQQQRSAEERVREQQAAVAIAEARRSECAISESRVREAEASLRQIQDSLSEIESRLREAIILAPCSGVVIARHVREGEIITAVSYYGAGAPIVTIGDLSTMLVKVDLNEVDVAQVKVGLAVEITADALPERQYNGQVTRIAPASVLSQGEAGIVRFPIEITIEDADASLKTGMTANVEIVCQRADDVLWVPNDAIFEKEKEEGKKFASVVTGEDKGGKPVTEDREVTAGLATDSRLEIKSGLAEGDEVQLGKTEIPERKKIDIRTGHDEEGD